MKCSVYWPNMAYKLQGASAIAIKSNYKTPVWKYFNIILDFISTGPNQLWVIDITCIHLGGFAYLSLITDAYNRKIVGFFLKKEPIVTRAIECFKDGPVWQSQLNRTDSPK